MDILRINAGKLKITLTRAECEAYNVKENGGDFDSVRVRDALGRILEEAGAADFYSGSEKLLVQLYPRDGGGAELFVTKLSHVGERERRAVTRSGNLSTYSKGRACYSFSNMGDLVRAARAARGKCGSSDLYTDNDGAYILSAEENKLGAMSDCDIFGEFGTRIPTDAKYLSREWYKLIYEGDALERLQAPENLEK